MFRTKAESLLLPLLKIIGILVVCSVPLHAAESSATVVSRTYANPAHADPAVAAEQKLADGSLDPQAYIARTVTIPAGYQTIYLSGILPEIPPLPAPPGDAEAQALNVFTRIGSILSSQGLSEADVVSMTVYMWAPDAQRMDFQGMMRAYARFYGTRAQPNRPVRCTVQVAQLGMARALLEVQVIAVRKPQR